MKQKYVYVGSELNSTLWPYMELWIIICF